MQLYSARFLLPVDQPPIEDGALLVGNGRILAIGTRTKLAAAHPGAAAVDFGDAVILPPMVNAHTHLELTHYPTWAQACGECTAPASFVDWIIQLVKVRRSVARDQATESLADGLSCSLAAGIGAVGDILTTFEAAGAYASSPLRGTVFCEVLGREQTTISRRLAAIDQLLATPCAAGLRWGISPHAPYTLTGDTASQISRFAASRSLDIAMHLAESRAEVDFLQTGQGAIAELLYAVANWRKPDRSSDPMRPLEWAGRYGCLAPGSLVVHGVHVTPAESELVARQGCSIVLCPRSNSAFGLERAPIRMYRSSCINLALGTDSRASASTLSIWDELAFAQSWFAATLQPSEWLEIATLGGARALGLDRQCGSLSPKKAASFQIVAAPAGSGLDDLEEGLCCLGSSAEVKALYLAGKPALPTNDACMD